MELGRVREGQLRRLFGHRPADFGDSVTYIDNRCLARRIEELASVRGKKPGTFAANGDGQIFLKITRKDGVGVWHARSLSDCNRLAQPARREQELRRLQSVLDLAIACNNYPWLPLI